MQEPQLPNELTVNFARELFTAWGEDTTPIEDNWCWPQFVKQYPHLLEKFEQYIERATTGDPAYVAYWMVHYGSNREWAEGVIERTKIGDPSWAAYLIHRFNGSSLEWCLKVARKHKDTTVMGMLAQEQKLLG